MLVPNCVHLKRGSAVMGLIIQTAVSALHSSVEAENIIVITVDYLCTEEVVYGHVTYMY